MKSGVLESPAPFPLCLTAAGEEGRGRDHDGRPLQGSFPEEILVSVSLHADVKLVPTADAFLSVRAATCFRKSAPSVWRSWARG